MKKKNLITCLFLSLLIVLLAVGCGKSTEIQDISSNTEKSPPIKETEQGKNVTDSEIVEQQSESDKEPKVTEKQSENVKTNSQQEVASVIVKSENNLSDSEKKEIVDQLSKEVDELLTEINTDE